MKKKIIIGLSIFYFFFLSGGIYIITTIESATSTLDNLITLHQVEILREHLLIHIKSVHSGITLKNTRFAKNINTVIVNVRNMDKMSGTCFECHHPRHIENELNSLRSDVNEYKHMISRLFTIRANAQRFENEENRVVRKGEELMQKVNNMISKASINLEKKTQASLKDIEQTKKNLYFLVSTVSFLAVILGLAFIRSFTKPLKTLLDATKRLESGDLDHKIVGLTAEFGEVANSFNEMAASLQENMHKIQENEKRYRTLFETAADGIFMIEIEGDNVGRIVSANPAAASMHGYTIDEITTLNMIKDLDSPEAAGETQDRIKRMIEGEWIKAEITHRRKDGTLFPVEISARLLEFMGHKYILAIDRDISDRKKAEEELLKRAEQMKLVGECASGVYHEIKNSLAGIKISVEVLVVNPDVSDEDRATVLKALDEIKRIETLLRSLLTFARLPNLQLKETNVNEVLENAVGFSLMAPHTLSPASPKINLVKDLADDLPLTLADNMQLRQVFSNLLINAKESMEEDGTITLKTSYDSASDVIKIEISDTGSGVEEEITNSIFRPFFTTKSKGTGLGLAISKKIIEEHDGTIEVTKRPVSGALFHISLPVKQVTKKYGLK